MEKLIEQIRKLDRDAIGYLTQIVRTEVKWKEARDQRGINPESPSQMMREITKSLAK